MCVVKCKYSGVAPKIRIRGTSTLIGNREPLWVVDGIVVSDQWCHRSNHQARFRGKTSGKLFYQCYLQASSKIFRPFGGCNDIKGAYSVLTRAGSHSQRPHYKDLSLDPPRKKVNQLEENHRSWQV